MGVGFLVTALMFIATETNTVLRDIRNVLPADAQETFDSLIALYSNRPSSSQTSVTNGTGNVASTGYPATVMQDITSIEDDARQAFASPIGMTSGMTPLIMANASSQQAGDMTERTAPYNSTHDIVYTIPRQSTV